MAFSYKLVKLSIINDKRFVDGETAVSHAWIVFHSSRRVEKRSKEDGKEKVTGQWRANAKLRLYLTVEFIVTIRREKREKRKGREWHSERQIIAFSRTSTVQWLNNKYLAREGKLIARLYLAIATIHRDSSAI